MNHTRPLARSSGSEFDGSAFSNNLFSDLAPLLTLFGEQVTKQFLSQAMGYGDDILLAMAPLGILTCVVSAIRVGGRKWLKALVGRARESRATAEMEIMSSTSDAVCELWSGAEIVRERGRPQTKEFIYRPVDKKAKATDLQDSEIVYDLKTACQEGILTITESRAGIWGWLPSNARPLIDERTRAVECATRLMQQAPNLTLNVTKAITSPVATWIFAALGIAVQLAVLVIASLVTYRWRRGENGSSSVVPYGFPLFLIGSVLLCAGIFLCSYIIESITEEVNFDLVEYKKDTKVVRIQCACTVGDQRFGSYAIMNEPGNTTIRTSRINDSPDFSFLSITATCLSLGGYILQFVGLRAMHWSVAIAVLGATLIMACVRAYVRRGLAANPEVEKLHEGHELSWVALDALGLSSFELSSTSGKQARDDAGSDKIQSTEAQEDTGAMASPLVRKAVEVRKELTQLVPWPDESIALAHHLATAITAVLQYVMEAGQFEVDYDGISALVFERTGESETNPEGEDKSRRQLNPHPLLSCRILTPEETRKQMNRSLEQITEEASTASLPYQEGDRKRSAAEKVSSAIVMEKIGSDPVPDDSGGGGVNVLNEPTGGESSAMAGAIESARRVAALLHYRRARREAERDFRRVETGNWFWENRDLIEEAAASHELTAPPGLCAYVFEKSEETFGASFKWETGVKLNGVSIGARQTADYGFFARFITQNLQDDDDGADSDVREPYRRRRPRVNSTENVWTTDVGSLAAVLSLWTMTLEDKLGPERQRHGFTRLLGCGWQVPVAAQAFATPEDESIAKVEQWMEASDPDQSKESNRDPEAEDTNNGYLEKTKPAKESGEMKTRADIASYSDQERHSNPGPSISAEHPGSQYTSIQSRHRMVMAGGGGQEYRLADFYSVWIERKTQAKTMITNAELVDQHSGSDSLNYENDDYFFGVFFSSYSRKLRLDALKTSNMQADDMQEPGTSNSTARYRPSRSSRPSLPDRNSTLLSYMPPSNGAVLGDGASTAPLNEEKAARSQTSLSRLCAQEIFSAFMLQLVASIAEVKGVCRRRAPLRGDHPNMLRWHHSGLSRLAGIVRDSKLATDEEEAYMLVIPAFHAYGLLPTRPTKIEASTYSSYYSYYTSHTSDSGDVSSRSTRRTRRATSVGSD